MLITRLIYADNQVYLQKQKHNNFCTYTFNNPSDCSLLLLYVTY